MSLECVRKYRGRSRWRSIGTRDGLYIALFSFHLRGVPPSAASLVLLRALVVRARASACLLISSILTSTSLLNPRSRTVHRLILLRTTTRSISCHGACGRSCVPSENNNRVGWQTGSVYLEGLNRLITSSDNDRTGWRQTRHARSMCS